MNIPLQSVLLVIISHWIGDYLLQTNQMAQNKSTRLPWLALHVLVYSAVLFSASIFMFTWSTALTFTVINGVLHFITDFVTGRVSHRYRGTPRIYYPIIGFDQLIHTLTLLITTSYFIAQ